MNASDIQQRRSWLEVELLNAENDEAIAGFSRQQSIKVCRDSVCIPLRWGDHRLANLTNARIKVRFHLFGAAQLHAFGFERDSNTLSGS